jgi:phage host-nuclease inhibitor protein Gam
VQGEGATRQNPGSIFVGGMEKVLESVRQESNNLYARFPKELHKEVL